MAIPALLQRDVDSLRAEGRTIDVVEDGTRYYVIFREFPTPMYTPTVAEELMVMTDYQYNQSKMDMFWTSPILRCSKGSMPAQAESIESYAGRQWQRWSYHYAQWDPARHNLRTHVEVVISRLALGT